MSSTRGPGGPSPLQPRGQNPQSKVEREEKQKVEKVGKVDIDEQRKKFKKALEGEGKGGKAEEEAEEEVLSLFDLEMMRKQQAESQKGEEEKDDLPQSDAFWSSIPLPDQPISQHMEQEHAPLQVPIIQSVGEIPSNIQPMVETAVSGAMAYLHPTTLTLFAKMVGTMYTMAEKSGISQTEIVLNHPSFANSPFYGSTIIVVKYDIAPDSFNIRLTGNQEAVNAFNQNLPNLMSAFQNGKFNFRVNRIEAEYAPTVRRKEGAREKRDKRGK